MMYMNSTILEGHLVRDPELKTTERGSIICKFSIAANRSWKTATGEIAKEVSYFDVESWGALAETCAEKCRKGQGVRIVGRLKQNRWEDAEGKTHSKITVVAAEIELKKFFSDAAAETADKKERTVKEKIPQTAEAVC